MSTEDREVIAALLDLKVSTMPRTFCNRILQSVINGRMTYEDYNNIARGKPTARAIRLIRGK